MGGGAGGVASSAVKREWGGGAVGGVSSGDAAARTVQAKALKAQLAKEVKKLDKTQQDAYVTWYFAQLEKHTNGGKINNQTPAQRQAFQDALEPQIVERFIKPSLNQMKEHAEKVLEREEVLEAMEVGGDVLEALEVGEDAVNDDE